MTTESLYIVPQFGKDVFIWAASAAEAREKAALPTAGLVVSANIATPKAISVIAPPKHATRIRETSVLGA